MNAGKDMGKRLADAAEEVRSKVMSYLAGNQLILLVIDSVFSLGMITGAITLALIRYEQGGAERWRCHLPRVALLDHA